MFAPPVAKPMPRGDATRQVVTKIGMMEYVVQFRVTHGRKAAILSSFTTGLRMGADYSWSRGVRSLMKNQMLAAK
jgi:hypothetical protein